MRLPISWLKEHVDVPVEPRKLADDLTLAGLAVDAVEGRGDEAVLDLDITTNRVDCMNVRGVAREAAVIYGTTLRPLATELSETGAPATEALRVVIEAPELCPRFCARILDVRMGPSPAWLRERLESVGVRPISNVVDLTNYVMMEMGHPSHAFDLAKIPSRELRVRWARPGESVRTLDGVERRLEAGMGVIAGPDGALSLAGIMGGASSEVSDDTRTVALEAAYWDPPAIRRTARALGMHTEASHRFERGADPEAASAATARIAHLLVRIGAGSVRPGLIDVRPAPPVERSAILRPARLRALLGVDVPEARAAAILAGLGFGVGQAESEGRRVAIPSWRGDVAREADLIEEVGRHHGLDKIPSSLPPARRRGGLRRAQLAARQVRDVLVGAGLDEVVRTSFVPAGLEARPAVTVANPLADVEGELRTSLVDPGLLDTLKRNLNHGHRDVRIFEVGRVFLPSGAGVEERTHLGVLLSGAGRPRTWSEETRDVDFFDAKGLVELLAARLGWPISLGKGPVPAWIHPGKSTCLLASGEGIGHAGAVHPEAAARLELRGEVFVAELRVDALLEAKPAEARARPLPRHPGVSRDLSLVLDGAIAAEELVAWAHQGAGALLRSVRVSGRYVGVQIPEGKVGLLLTLHYQEPERTLTSDEVQASVEGAVRALRARGVEIRGE
ncbi:MAG TPA: phenylalanine--tRNA ligase subunit beta [Vicinamibacteria bacterium]|nr:phenylalanine--tRNA ligase subunit beta [Vicinamibacteria bacterium]